MSNLQHSNKYTISSTVSITDNTKSRILNYVYNRLSIQIVKYTIPA